MNCNYFLYTKKFTLKWLTRKDFDDSFGKICIVLQMAVRKNFAKPDKRSISKEGGE